MRVYKEAEAVGYLERLNTSMGSLDYDWTPPFSNFKPILTVELSYFRRLLRDPAKKELAILGVSSSGFPELPSLMGDIKRAYEELDVIEAEVGMSIYPLFQQLDLKPDLAIYKEGVAQVMVAFEKEQEHINLLKERKTAALGLRTDKYIPDPIDDTNNSPKDSWGASIYNRQDRNGLLFYDQGVTVTKVHASNFRNSVTEWKYSTGFLKYIDLTESTPILIASRQKAVSTREKTTNTYMELKSVPKNNGFYSLLEPLNQTAREMILSVDFTNFTDEMFHEFIQSSYTMGALLKNIVFKPEMIQTAQSSSSSSRSWLQKWGIKI